MMISTIRRFVCSATLLGCYAVLQAQTDRLPTFEDYRTTDTLKGKPAPAKPVSADAKRYRTAIKEGAKEGPNFAGRSTIVTWGCGSACLMFAIVDGTTGRVFVAPFTVSLGGHFGQVEDLIDYRPDSKLLIITGDINEEKYGRYYYAWDNGRLNLLHEAEPTEADHAD